MSINIMPEKDAEGNVITRMVAFTAKSDPTTGLKLFRRVHGITCNLTSEGNTEVIFSVPYNQCKVNEVNIVWCPEGVQVDFQVLDTPTGTISTIPDYMLNQFGFDVNVSKDYFEDISSYDADLIKDMQLKIIFKQKSGYTSTKEVGINIVLHEMK